MKILWMTNHATGYYRYLYDNIEADPEMELTVAYKQQTKSSHPWKDDFKADYKIIDLDEALGLIDRKSMDLVVIGGWNDRRYVKAAMKCAVKKLNFAVLTDTPKRTSGHKMLAKRLYLHGLKLINNRFKLFATGEIGVHKARQLFNLPEKNVVNFPWVTNNELFQPNGSPTRKEDEKIQLLSVGRLVLTHKGQDITIGAIRALKPEVRDKVRLLIAGTGPDQEAISRLVEDLHLEDNVELLGWLEEREVVELMKSVHALVHSSHFDPYPNCVLEALSCGTPVLGSDAAGSVVDRVENGVNGWMHKEGDSEELAKQITALVEMPADDYSAMQARCRAMALEWPVGYNLEVLRKIGRLSSVRSR